MCLLTWVLTIVLTFVQALLETVKTLTDHRVLTNLILFFKKFRQIILKTAGNCENYGLINNFIHDLGQCLELEDNRVWYGTVMILQTLYSPELSQFEKISTFQLCSLNLGTCHELRQRSTNLIILGSAPDYEEKYGTTSSCDSISHSHNFGTW